MGLYNFKDRFEAYVRDGSKTHTIRAERRHSDRPGKPMHLYCGLRHKGARKLLPTQICRRVDFIRIEEDGHGSIASGSRRTVRVLIGASSGDPHYIGGADGDNPRACHGFIELTEGEKNALAWRDGFRPPGSTVDAPGGAFRMMLAFWDGRLPFEGLILHWGADAPRWGMEDAACA